MPELRSKQQTRVSALREGEKMNALKKRKKQKEKDMIQEGKRVEGKQMRQ